MRSVSLPFLSVLFELPPSPAHQVAPVCLCSLRRSAPSRVRHCTESLVELLFSSENRMDDWLLPLVGALLLVVATYYYFVVLNKPKKLAAIPAPMVKKGTAAAQKRKVTKKKEEVCV